jgi:amino acid permease
MSWFLLILAALSTLMLWRDLRSGRIYYTDEHAGLDYDDPEPFYEKSSSPTLYRVVIVTVAVCCLIASGLGILFFFIPEEYLFDSKPLLILFTIAFIVLILYLIYGAVGRATSWIKNYGSIDKKW